MRVGRDTRQSIDAIKSEVSQMVSNLEMCALRLEEYPGTKRMTKPLKNAIEKIRRWENTQHFTVRRPR